MLVAGTMLSFVVRLRQQVVVRELEITVWATPSQRLTSGHPPKYERSPVAWLVMGQVSWIITAGESGVNGNK